MMKSLLRKLLMRGGQTLVPSTTDPVLLELLQAYRELRLRSGDAAYWQHRLSRVAAMGHLRDLLAKHRIGCVLDVGANTGQFAQSLRKLGYQGRIVSFEPMDQARAQLERAASSDPRWEVLPVALGREHAELNLQIFADDTFSSLHDMRGEASSIFCCYVEKVGSQRVQVERLDDLWPRLFHSDKEGPVLLKTDTQGHDLEVLQGRSVHCKGLPRCFRRLRSNAFTRTHRLWPSWPLILKCKGSGPAVTTPFHIVASPWR